MYVEKQLVMTAISGGKLPHTAERGHCRIEPPHRALIDSSLECKAASEIKE